MDGSASLHRGMLRDIILCSQICVLVYDWQDQAPGKHDQLAPALYRKKERRAANVTSHVPFRFNLEENQQPSRECMLLHTGCNPSHVPILYDLLGASQSICF